MTYMPVRLPGGTVIYTSDGVARRQYYDRNPIPIVRYFWLAIGPGIPDVEQWRYTVPAGKKAIHSVLFGGISGAESIFSSGVKWELSIDGGLTWNVFAYIIHHIAPGNKQYTFETITVTFALVAGNIIRCLTYNDDNIAHWMRAASLLTEFDA